MAEDDSGQEQQNLIMRLTQIEDRLTALETQGKGLRDYVVGQAYGVARSHKGTYPPPLDPDAPAPGPGEYLQGDDGGDWLNKYHC